MDSNLHPIFEKALAPFAPKPAGHTPGPWVWNETGYSLRPAVKSEGSPFVTILEVETWGMVERGCDISRMSAEGDANLALIAAAPELLAALERIAGFTLSQFMGPHDMALECVNVAIAAIAKAKGESDAS